MPRRRRVPEANQLNIFHSCGTPNAEKLERKVESFFTFFFYVGLLLHPRFRNRLIAFLAAVYGHSFSPLRILIGLPRAISMAPPQVPLIPG